MSGRNLYVSKSASTPIEKVSLPSLPMSEIEATSSLLKYRKRAMKNENSSSSSDLRDSKERALSGNARMKSSSRRPYVSGTPDELRRERRRMKFNERKKMAKRNIEISDRDDPNWQTTRENNLSVEFDQAEVPIEEAPTERVEELEVVENLDLSDGATSAGCEKPQDQSQTNANRSPEALRDAARVVDDLERGLEKPLLHVPAEEESDVPSKVQLIDFDTDSVLIVNDHGKSYPAATQKEARNPAPKLGNIGIVRRKDRFPQAARNQQEKRHVRNRRVMMEIRKGVEEKRSLGRRQLRRKKRSSPCKTATTYGSLAEGDVRIYDFISPFEESDDEVFVVDGLRFLRNPPRRKFFRPTKTLEMKINWETGTYTTPNETIGQSVVPQDDENRRVAKARKANKKSASPVEVTAIDSRDRTSRGRSIGNDTEGETTTKETAGHGEKSATGKKYERSNFDELAGHSSKETISRSNRTTNKSKTATRAIGKSSRSMISSNIRKGIDTSDNRTSSDDDGPIFDSTADRRRKNGRSTRPKVGKNPAFPNKKSSRIDPNIRVNTPENRPSAPIESDDDDSSADYFPRRPVKRRNRITSGRTKSGDSCRGRSLENFPTDRKAGESIGKKSAPSRSLGTSISREAREISLERCLSTEVKGPSKKKYRRIASLIYADSSPAPEESAKMAVDSPTIENSRASFSKIEEPVASESDDTLIIDHEDIGECSEVEKSVSAKNMLNAILKETSSDDSRKRRNKIRKIVRRSSSSRSSSSKSHHNSSTNSPKILTTSLSHDRVVETYSPTIENSRPSFSKIDEPAACESDDTLIIDNEDVGECSEVEKSVSAENMLNTILEETSSDDSRKRRNKIRKIVRRSSSSRFSLTKSHHNSSNNLPKILTTTLFHEQVVERCRSNRWKLHLPKNFEVVRKDA